MSVNIQEPKGKAALEDDTYTFHPKKDADSKGLTEVDGSLPVGREGDDVEYVKGHPVVKTGAHVSKYIVPLRDDGDPAITFRSIILGTAFSALASAINMIYVFKPKQMYISGVFLQLLIFLFGTIWATLTPKPERIPIKWTQKILRFLNFGQPFCIKEHVVASLIAGNAPNGMAGIEVFAIERLFYNKGVSALTAVLAIFSITLIGFVLAGLMRPLIVYPSEAVHWEQLPEVTVFHTLHKDRVANWSLLKKFLGALSGAAVWQVFPSYIAPWLGGISIFCLASQNAPKKTRAIFTNIFGGASPNEGLGILSLGLDWQYIGAKYVAWPLKQQINQWIGFVIFYIVAATLYYTNTWGSRRFPILSTALFSANGTTINMTRIVDSEGHIDYGKVDTVGLPHLTSSTVWGFTTANLSIGALITHVFIFFGKDIRTAWKQARDKSQPDPHYQAMLKYKEVPTWWYLTIFVLCFLAGIIVNIKGHTTLAVWEYIVALILGFFVAPFSTILDALYGASVFTNQLSNMVGGIVAPGRPLANLYFSSWCHQVVQESIHLSSWMKIGQYTKVPPRALFWVQIYGSLLGPAFNYPIMMSIIASQRDVLLAPRGNTLWSGALLQQLNAESVSWSLATQTFGIHGRYPIVPLALLVGLGLPIIHWLVARCVPRVRKYPINTPIIATFAGHYYYGTTSWIWSSIAVGIFSQAWLRRRYPAIYNKYNYLIGAALDGGSQLVIFILSFAVFGASGKAHPFPTWWGHPTGYPDHCMKTT